jgi:hypothetical protein
VRIAVVVFGGEENMSEFDWYSPKLGEMVKHDNLRQTLATRYNCSKAESGSVVYPPPWNGLKQQLNARSPKQSLSENK